MKSTAFFSKHRRLSRCLAVVARSGRGLLALLLLGLLFLPWASTSSIWAQSISILRDAAFVQQAYLKGPDLQIDANAGRTVAISGDLIAVGAPGAQGNAGAVYLFARNGTTWLPQAYITPLQRGANDFFGWSVALSGDTLVVGAFGEDSRATGVNGDATDNSAADAGAAYIFVRSGTTWTQQAYLKASNTEAADWFGRAVAISGNTVVVGAIDEDSNATGVNGDEQNNTLRYAGAAYVFVRSGATWTQEAYLKASNPDAEDFFGIAVAVSGDTVVVGASEEASNATGVNGDQLNNGAFEAGAAYVFVRSGTTWTQQAYLKASNTEIVDRFGSAVTLEGDTVVIGAIGERSNATGVNGDQLNNHAPGSGAAYVFVRNGTAWTQQAYLKAANPEVNDFFGYAVALSTNLLVVGARYEDSNAPGVNGDTADNAATDAGAAYLFARSGTTWRPQAYLKASNPGAGDWFGESVAVADGTIVVGASAEDSNATTVDGNPNDAMRNAGAAYVFALETNVLTVNTTADPGDGTCDAAECTLREALALANTRPGENVIAFNIPGSGPHTIQPIGDLPPIIDRVIIDGYTQPGAQPNTNPMTEPINAVILVEIDGSRAPEGFYFTGNSGDSVIRGLALNRFARAIGDARRTVIEGNFIGTDPSGTQALGNGVGIDTAGGVGGSYTTIGGGEPAARNLISGNGTGIHAGTLSYITVAGNFIGTDVTGSWPLANGKGISSSIYLEAGGRMTLRDNLISGNEIGADFANVCCTVTGNLFGVDRTGQFPLPNTSDGLVVGPFDLTVSNNHFAYNGGSGIHVQDADGPNTIGIAGNHIFANGAAGITVTGNRAFARITNNVIYGNGTLGIDLGDDGVTLNDPGDGDQGVNSLQNFPVVGLATSNSATRITGVMNSTPNTDLSLAFYTNTICDPSRFGEGASFLGTVAVTTDASGNVPFATTLPLVTPHGAFVAATATGPHGTSEFSSCRVVGAARLNNLLKIEQIKSRYKPTPAIYAPAGVMRLTATFKNRTKMPLAHLYFRIAALSGNNLLLNADDGPGMVGTVLSVPTAIAPKASFTVHFDIGLQARQPFYFFIDAYGLLPGGRPAAAETDATAAALFDLSVDTAALVEPTTERLDNPVYLPLVNR